MLVDTSAIGTLLESLLTVTVVVIITTIVTTHIAGLPTRELHEVLISLSAVS